MARSYKRAIRLARFLSSPNSNKRLAYLVIAVVPLNIVRAVSLMLHRVLMTARCARARECVA